MDGSKRDWIIAGAIGGFIAWGLYQMTRGKEEVKAKSSAEESLQVKSLEQKPKMRFQISRLSASLKTKVLGRHAEFKDTVTSTMTEAADLVSAKGASEANGSVVLAEEQTQGIGRRDRAWRSAPAGNIYMSFVWSEPELDLQQKIHRALQLNFACGIAVARAARNRGVQANVKWPNDVWVGTRKMAGSLVNFDGKDTAIAGIGVNVNQSRESLDAVVGRGVACCLRSACPFLPNIGFFYTSVYSCVGVSYAVPDVGSFYCPIPSFAL
eukprot:m.113004 g.113004  ORF g.113004 m.113004 type:complete len:267 (-) comp17055_c0_seq3:955-1755(-)